MSALDEVWTRLREIRALQFQSESRSETGWNGAGSGIVEVTSISADTLVFDESGYWQQSQGNRIRFTNSSRWTRIANHLGLEHLRFGATDPVFLFEMAPDADGVWHDVDPHPCRDDCYSATLRLDTSRLLIDWSVYSPKRDESIGYIYF